MEKIILKLPDLLSSQNFSTRKRAIISFSSIFSLQPKLVYDNFELFCPFFLSLFEELEAQLINIKILNNIILNSLSSHWKNMSPVAKVSIFKYFAKYFENSFLENPYVLFLKDQDLLVLLSDTFKKDSTLKNDNNESTSVIPYIKRIYHVTKDERFKIGSTSPEISRPQSTESEDFILPPASFTSVASIVFQEDFFNSAMDSNIWKVFRSPVENIDQSNNQQPTIIPNMHRYSLQLEGYAKKQAGDSKSFQTRYFQLFIDNTIPYGDKCLVWRDSSPNAGKQSSINGALIIASSTPITLSSNGPDERYVTISPYQAKEYKFLFETNTDSKLTPLTYESFVNALTGNHK